ncbi:hypothetical protein GCM10010112_67830 [Actinoplanes lobatus]|uniref:Uncharacterized protein n=1 Tax=Actinoplanes lobatus TaxID=113568 RepID=A0A7W7HFG3_9ACTN|nr:hypothetical protein [Actinoplanes lobatus]MBB4749137.1 hypothetical protein [Actinoplanes lobatus]GGN86359.1 hypothetical protein GCM10010112_67830 [Actinoplanes lobatus]GIE42765.1 hypothetical protein Alo02nite_56630 [Actinoplanes lobatus]
MPRYRIKAPTRVTGLVVGVLFNQGVAEGEPSRQALAYFGRHAYRVTRLDEPAPAPAPADDPADPDAPKRPAKSASKADWVAYAVAQGVDPAEAEALTRDQLAERSAEPEGDAK